MGSGLKAGRFAQKVLAHATAGGVISVLQGGKFGHGFVSAGVAEAGASTIDGNLHSKFAKVAASAMVGGSVSYLAGGKFGNGAATGAMQMAFNELAHGTPPIDSAIEGAPGYEDDYVEPAERSMFQSGMEGEDITWPTGHSTVTSIFGMRPRNGVMEMHPGVDIRAYLNDPVYSTQAGTVTTIGPQTAAGFTLNIIRITNNDGSISGYGHVSPSAGLVVGASVSMGQEIGFSDGSGPVAPHVHLTYRRSASSPGESALLKQLHSVKRPTGE